ncbi:hypothetical protein PISMIDRAFT_677369 [Pisolithus microcarpus 441]|uniref:Unplaced genomic scaffold scaffold_26, whole genome shotgun sequence n=1 Tax=Pisolithus microcarpus 441 TaxID=765257 RepID=A0A0C9YJL7_9AGAM|nr:hypothetical protein PISMIDRAFT_677369 [Pisolithus microcarpus 441]
MLLVDCVNVSLQQMICWLRKPIGFAARSQSPSGRAETAVHRASQLRVDIEPEASDKQTCRNYFGRPMRGVKGGYNK